MCEIRVTVTYCCLEPNNHDDNLPAGPLVYLLEDSEPFGRAGRTDDDVLYMGMTTRRSPTRLRNLFAGNHTAWRVLEALCVRRGGPFEANLRWFICDNAVHARLLESLRLTHALRRTGELPPANRRWEGFLGGNVLRELYPESNLRDIRDEPFSAENFRRVTRLRRHNILWLWPTGAPNGMGWCEACGGRLARFNGHSRPELLYEHDLSDLFGNWSGRDDLNCDVAVQRFANAVEHANRSDLSGEERVRTILDRFVQPSDVTCMCVHRGC